VIGEMEGKIWNTENPNMFNWIWISIEFGLNLDLDWKR